MHKKSYFVFAIMLTIFCMVSSANAGLFGWGGSGGHGGKHNKHANHESFNPAPFMIPVVDNKPIFEDHKLLVIEPAPSGGPFIDVNGKVGSRTQPVPEPSTLILLGFSLVALAGFSRNRFHN